jgi:hypothetical protein
VTNNGFVDNNKLGSLVAGTAQVFDLRFRILDLDLHPKI